jgi:hypothetical protein
MSQVSRGQLKIKNAKLKMAEWGQTVGNGWGIILVMAGHPIEIGFIGIRRHGSSDGANRGGIRPISVYEKKSLD